MLRPFFCFRTLAAIAALMIVPASSLFAQRQMERLGRGVIAVPQSDSNVFVSWRLSGTEPADLAFNVYRQTGGGEPVRLNAEPLAGPTHFVDSAADLSQGASYFVRPVQEGVEQAASRPFTIPAGAAAQPYLSVKLQTPEGYRPNDASVGDLDGDGEYEIVLHQAGRARDNSQAGETDPPILQAYKLDGTLLWTINLGRNIRDGAHYTQFMVYDLDGDGRAEVACKTADGTVDGRGTVIGDGEANFVNERGYILDGPEFLTVFDGQTGAALATTDYIPPRGDVAAWGDDYGNRVDRFLACVAYLDGERPSLVMCRGYYTRAVLAAFNFRHGQLSHVWTFDSDDGTPGNRSYRGQGNHGIGVADVDGDGRDEIIYGSAVIDDNGQGIYATGFGHGDAMHVTDHDPARPGLEIYKANGDNRNEAGIQLRDAATGTQLFGVASTGNDGVGRACAFDIDPRYLGSEMWGAGQGVEGLFTVTGEKIADRGPPSCNMAIWWDGDLVRELLDGATGGGGRRGIPGRGAAGQPPAGQIAQAPLDGQGNAQEGNSQQAQEQQPAPGAGRRGRRGGGGRGRRGGGGGGARYVTVSKWDYENNRQVPLLEGSQFDAVTNNGTKANPSLCADILGDWREEIISPTQDGSELRIFSTTIPTEHRIYTLMHDPVYRLSVAWQNVCYNQPAHTGFYLGHGMQPPPRPEIRLVGTADLAAE